tara:strand:+ start:417 stop:767 length:351 start_codon:yes stop_codon:yes gene_type:complete
MSVKLVMLKSGEDIIADVKEIKSNDDVIGYYFDNPLIIKIFESEEPKVLNEEGSNKEYTSSVGVTFFPWIPLSKDDKVPCSADWVVTIVEPIEKLKKQYQEKLNGRNKGDQSSVIV